MTYTILNFRHFSNTLFWFAGMITFLRKSLRWRKNDDGENLRPFLFFPGWLIVIADFHPTLLCCYFALHPIRVTKVIDAFKCPFVLLLKICIGMMIAFLLCKPFERYLRPNNFGLSSANKIFFSMSTFFFSTLCLCDDWFTAARDINPKPMHAILSKPRTSMTMKWMEKEKAEHG